MNERGHQDPMAIALWLTILIAFIAGMYAIDHVSSQGHYQEQFDSMCEDRFGAEWTSGPYDYHRGVGHYHVQCVNGHDSIWMTVERSNVTTVTPEVSI